MRGEQRRVDLEALQQRARDARVLGGDRIDVGEHPERTQADVGEVADRRRDDEQRPLRPVLRADAGEVDQSVVDQVGFVGMARVGGRGALSARRALPQTACGSFHGAGRGAVVASIGYPAPMRMRTVSRTAPPGPRACRYVHRSSAGDAWSRPPAPCSNATVVASSLARCAFATRSSSWPTTARCSCSSKCACAAARASAARQRVDGRKQRRVLRAAQRYPSAALPGFAPGAGLSLRRDRRRRRASRLAARGVRRRLRQHTRSPHDMSLPQDSHRRENSCN